MTWLDLLLNPFMDVFLLIKVMKTMESAIIPQFKLPLLKGLSKHVYYFVIAGMPLFQSLLDRKNSDSSSRSLGSKHSSSASSSSSSSMFDVRSTESTELFSTPSGSSDESDCLYNKVNNCWVCLKYPMKTKQVLCYMKE